MGSADPLNAPASPGLIILFDGVCNLCNGSVQFVIRKDTREKFRFAALQSDFGTAFLKEHGVAPGVINSVMLIRDGKVFWKSNAALEIARHLPGLWPLFYAFKIVPAFIRNWVYDLVAKNRYRIWGRTEECMIPTPALRRRFI